MIYVFCIHFYCWSSFGKIFCIKHAIMLGAVCESMLRVSSGLFKHTWDLQKLSFLGSKKIYLPNILFTHSHNVAWIVVLSEKRYSRDFQIVKLEIVALKNTLLLFPPSCLNASKAFLILCTFCSCCLLFGVMKYIWYTRSTMDTLHVLNFQPHWILTQSFNFWQIYWHGLFLNIM